MPQPSIKPDRPHFSSGPCAKRAGWRLDNLANAYLGRSHRSAEGKRRLRRAIDETRDILEIPEDYRIGIVPASDTGAVEMALWGLLGARGVDVFAWESFSKDWANDIIGELQIADARLFEADYGELPDLNAADFERDIVFAWNGTTSGVRVPDSDWIASDRGGLTICDATSALFAQLLDWRKLDVVTFSWQKVLGGEAAHGMIILSPRAIAQRLESWTPPRPLPKIFRLTKKGKLIEGIFTGETINTPSMLCVEDYLDALAWVRGLGGLSAMTRRADDNLRAIGEWVAKTDWINFLAEDPRLRSNTSICLKITDAAFAALAADQQQIAIKHITQLLEAADAAYDIASYRAAPPGLRLWGGGTVERGDLEKLFPWLDWAFEEVQSKGMLNG